MQDLALLNGSQISISRVFYALRSVEFECVIQIDLRTLCKQLLTINLKLSRG